MRRAARALGALVAALSVWAPAHAADATAATTPTTLSSLIADAARLDGDVVAAEATRSAAHAAERVAGRWDDPRLGLEGGRRVDDGEDGWLGRIDLTQRVPVAGAHGARRLIAQSRASGAESAASAARAEVAIDVARLLARWSAAVARHEARQAAFSASDEAAAAVRQRLAAGDAGDADELATRIAAEEAAEEARLAQQAAEAARARLARRCGRVEAGMKPVPLELEPIERAAALAGVERHPRLRVAAAELAIVEATARGTRAQRWDDVRAGAFAERDDDETTVGLSLEVPLPAWNRNVAAIGEADAAIIGARARQGTLQRILQADAETAWFAWDAARQRATYHADHLLPAARQAMSLALVDYGAGRASLSTVLDARRTLARLALAFADATEARDLALIDLHAAVGGGEDLQ